MSSSKSYINNRHPFFRTRASGPGLFLAPGTQQYQSAFEPGCRIAATPDSAFEIDVNRSILFRIKRGKPMYYFEKDYIMRLIHGVSRMLAWMIFGKNIAEEEELVSLMEKTCRENHDYLRQMIDSGQINQAEEKLFDLIETVAWDDRQIAALVLSFYDYLNSRDDDFLARSDFSRDEIISGLEDAMKMMNMEIPEYLKIT